jgi:acrylyl-CoA reductase (NADPH)
MGTQDFKALLLKSEDGKLIPVIEQISLDAWPDGDVIIDVQYSSINYKDAMAIGNRGIIRKFPAVPGIDLAGTVRESANADFKPGDAVVLTGWGVGERHWGGYSQVARVKSEWLVPLPTGLSLKQSMQIGTAGLTAMLCIQGLEQNGLKKGSGPILVTGASGGVGSIAVAILASLGYEVWAMTRPDQADYLTTLGAAKIVGRNEFAPSKAGRPVLEAENFPGIVDTVGGVTLANLLARVSYRGSVASCGLVGGTEIDTTVFPFIIRGVNLLGIDSVRCPTPVRLQAWERLARQLPKTMLEQVSREISLEEVPLVAAELLAGQGHGRVVIKL